MMKKKYNTKSSDAFGGTTGRLSMVRVGLALSFFVFTVATGCVDNEQSFYIEHMKAPPDPPECSVSVGDKFAPAISLNMMMASAPGTFFQVTNALISREDYGNLRAESNGIQVDGYEVYTEVPGVGVVGGTSYFTYNQYLPPESTELLHAQVLTTEAINELTSGTSYCPRYSPATVADAIFYTHLSAAAPGDDRLSLTADEQQAARDGATVINNLLSTGFQAELIYSVVRFLGHTQGNKDVETPEFSVPIYPYCGVVGGWAPCLQDVCAAFCSDNAAYVPSCDAGVNQIMTCADYISEYKTRAVKYTDPVTSLPATDDVCTFFECK
jgi:hypothetical protein